MSSNTVTLNSGAEMPLLGLGTWKSKDGEVQAAVSHALKSGYTHLDCAAVYGNEVEVGEGIKASGVDRSGIFVVSKLWNSCHHPDDVRPACEKTLKDLGLDYVDLYLIHWPMSFQRGEGHFPKNEDGSMKYSEDHYTKTWAAMEQLVDAGLVKSIGVSNFNATQIQEILDVARIPPAVNQIESHPYHVNEDLVKACQDKGIVVTAYSPLASPDRPWGKDSDPVLLKHPVVVAMAERLQKNVGQVLIRFQLQRGIVCIPKSVTPSRIETNMQVFDFTLSDEDMQTLRGLDQCWRNVPCIEVDGKMVPRDAAHPYFPF